MFIKKTPLSLRCKGRLKRYNIKGRNLDGQADRSKEEEAPLFFIFYVMYLVVDLNMLQVWRTPHR